MCERGVLRVSAGALPEAVNGLSPCLDPEDEEAWFAALGEWIEDPAARLAYEQKIRSSFAWPSWTQAAARMLDEAEV